MNARELLSDYVLHCQHLRSSKIVGLPKGENPHHGIGKYRPISLLPSLGKVMEALITACLTFFLESKGQLHPTQYGFRAQRNTETALNAVTKKIEESLDSGMVAYGCSVDI